MSTAPEAHRSVPSSVDLLVIGGGITGAGVAHDAARRGIHTLLVEREDFAAGTSSRSSRLVHGGVRYLEHGWLHLVFEASRERRRLLTNAPHLVRPLRFTWPLYEGQRLARWEIGAGLMLYDVLALFRNVGRQKQLGPKGVTAREPGLRTTGLRGGAAYWDAATDDARLTLATAIGAERAGATLATHTEVVGLVRDGDRVVGAELRDRLTGAEQVVRATVLVNATGPYTAAIRRLESAALPPVVQGTKGVHILIPRASLSLHEAVTLLHPRDARVMFALPAGRYALIGTTDTTTTASPDEVRADEQDVAYLLEAVAHYFPAARVTRHDVLSAWAGIRPLIAAAPGTAPSDQSREHAIVTGPGGVLGVSGGKLTTYRAMAEEIVDVVAERLGGGFAACSTARATLPGGDLDLQDALTQAARATGDATLATRLVHAHGSAWDAVWALGTLAPALRERVVPSCDAIKAELVHAALHEHARTLSDLLIRRTPVAFESADQGVSVAAEVATLVGPHLGWDAAAQTRAVAAYEADVARVFGVEGAGGVG
jgi:glycerol-3-phosphate dehydrogenase